MKRIALILALPLILLSCDAPPDTIAGRIQDGVVKACAFKADFGWLTEIVTKADVTAQMVDQMVDHLCERVVAARNDTAQALVSKCPYGEIEVAGETVCIEGEPVEPKEGE